METESYTIKTGAYEGPFGVLLNLVEKRKLFINDLSLAQVTEDYLAYINNMGRANAMPTGRQAAETSSFILVAATLILIKSKSLLPNLALTNEEEGDISALEERLRLYEKFSKLSQHVKELFGEQIIFSPLERKNDTLVFLPDDQITRESMMTFARGALGRIPQKTVMQEVEVKKVISIEEMIGKLTDRIQTSIQKMSFHDFSMPTSRQAGKGGSGKPITKEEKVFVIVGFLAMLELVRQGILNAVQESHGEDIVFEKRDDVGEGAMPDYEQIKKSYE